MISARKKRQCGRLTPDLQPFLRLLGVEHIASAAYSASRRGGWEPSVMTSDHDDETVGHEFETDALFRTTL